MVTDIQRPCPREGCPQCPRCLLVKLFAQAPRISGQSCAFPAHSWVNLRTGKRAMTLDGEIAEEESQGTERETSEKTLSLPGHQTNAEGTKIPIFPIRRTRM